MIGFNVDFLPSTSASFFQRITCSCICYKPRPPPPPAVHEGPRSAHVSRHQTDRPGRPQDVQKPHHVPGQIRHQVSAGWCHGSTMLSSFYRNYVVVVSRDQTLDRKVRVWENANIEFVDFASWLVSRKHHALFLLQKLPLNQLLQG